MIDIDKGSYFLACEICGKEVGGFKSFEDAFDYLESKHWESDRGEQLDLQEGWIDICPECQERRWVSEKHTTAF